MKQAQEVLDVAIRRQSQVPSRPRRLFGSFAGPGNLLTLRRPTGKIGGPPISARAGVNWTGRGGVASWILGCTC